MIIADTTLFIAVFEKKITPFISYLLRLLKASRTFFWNDYELTVTPVNLNDVLLKMFVKSTLCFQQTIFQKKKKNMILFLFSTQSYENEKFSVIWKIFGEINLAKTSISWIFCSKTINTSHQKYFVKLIYGISIQKREIPSHQKIFREIDLQLLWYL